MLMGYYVLSAVDTLSPIISNCPPDMTVTVELGDAGVTVTWIAPTATDISGTTMLITTSHEPGSFFGLGQTTVTYIFADASFNQATCTFVIDIVSGNLHSTLYVSYVWALLMSSCFLKCQVALINLSIVEVSFMNFGLMFA